MSTKAHLRISAKQFCEPLDTTSWYDLTTGPRTQLADPLQLADGVEELNASVPLIGQELLDWVEGNLSARFHGKGGRLHFKVAEPEGHIISAENFVEALLGAANRIDSALRRLCESATGTAWTHDREEQLLEIIDGVRDGKIDTADLLRAWPSLISSPEHPGITTCLRETHTSSLSRPGLRCCAPSIMLTGCWRIHRPCLQMKEIVSTCRSSRARKSSLTQ